MFKNIKRYTVIAALGLTAVAATSCESYLDINTDPYASTKVEPKLLFNYATTNWAANRAGGDNYIPIALSAQTIASGGNFGWGKDNVYEISPYSTGNTWKAYYATAGLNLVQAIAEAEKASPANNNAAAQAKIELATMMYEATLIWGDIPFSESWQESISYPKFDAQKSVFEQVIGLLDEAIAQIDETSPLKISEYDLIYNGDLSKWKSFAKSIKFKTYMVMVDKDPSVASKIGQMLNEGGMVSSAAANFTFPFYNTPDKENPRYKILKRYAGGSNIFFFANNNVLSYMKQLEDPRIPVYFDKPAGVSTYNGVDSEEEADATTATISMYLYRPDAPEVVYTYQEQLYLEAEAYARGLGVGQDLNKANELYKKATLQALLFNGIASSTAQDYVDNTLPALTSVAKPVDQIHLMQWIDLMDRPLEAWTQWRRSGSEGNEVPTLTQPEGTPAGGLIRRWVYSPDEATSNANTPSPTPIITQKLWFDL
ncbi:SusD/RagB family nutrient-binding outer membrane lipoprotein [Pontibacter oryzae]|uniref:SusD/RagB family nutrient-binding outer membrane lipoprotein n=1 Tax=Pontibacter oryzae TaxID=2304593 RepID=A0A399RY60_9BACT|nr:SusD/RagB family nutrient-binding outer membrane lipoprotein [Pontibacter oryzae]